MPYYITIKNKEDYEYLKSYLVKWRERAAENINAYVEHVDTFERLAAAFETATRTRPQIEPTPAKKKKKLTKKQRDALLPNLCKEHPRFSGVRAPMHGCEECWAVYKKYSGNAKYVYARTRFDRKQKNS